MDKRWRNLGVMIVLVVVLVFLALNPQIFSFETKSELEKIIESSDYTKEEFEVTLGSLGFLMDDGLKSNLLENCDNMSPADCAFVEKAVEVDDSKKAFREKVLTYFEGSPEEICISIEEKEDGVDGDVIQLSESIEDLYAMENSVLTEDWNTGYFYAQNAMMKENFSEYYFSCVMTYSALEEEEKFGDTQLFEDMYEIEDAFAATAEEGSTSGVSYIE